MNYHVVTSFNQSYWEDVARKNVQLLDRFWPERFKINLYHQLETPEHGFSSRIAWYDLYKSCPEIITFQEKWKDHPNANGAKNFRTNAIKFVHKTFAIWHQAKVQQHGWLIWFDCDAIPLKKIDETFLNNILPQNYAISYMGRPGKYSECGFIGFNLDRNETKEFLLEWENLYVSGSFIDLPETHDSWTFDFLRLKKSPKLFFNVNSKAKTNKHPFSQSMIGSHFAHAKGEGKQNKSNRIINRQAHLGI